MREDLSMTQKDKFMLQVKVSELKNNMKTLLQQNQQLKLDLRRGAAKTVSSCAIRGTGLRAGREGSLTQLWDHIQQLRVEVSGRELCLDNRPHHFILFSTRLFASFHEFRCHFVDWAL